MQESKKKRERSENWLEEDKILLKELVRERVLILENKNTNTNTNHAKMEAWTNLTESFNAMCKVPRSITQIKAQWSLLKIMAKKQKSAEMKAVLRTGGGPAPRLVPTTSGDICSWLPQEFATDSNEFDSDNIHQIVFMEHLGAPIDTEPAPVPTPTNPTATEAASTPIQIQPIATQTAPTPIQIQRAPVPIRIQPTATQTSPTPIKIQLQRAPVPIRIQPTATQTSLTPIKIQLQRAPVPTQIQPTVIQTASTQIQRAPVPIRIQPTATQTAPTPIQTAPTPIQSAPTPIQTAPTPIQTAPTQTKTNPLQSSNLRNKRVTTIKKKKSTQHSSESLMAYEMKCREELHKAQMANELLKELYLKKKIELIEKKINKLN